ncbi:MAG: hypothetical protein GXY96_01210 [Tissierellia bacterium]|nr:hypothetical protein [Tissierellia bacterium]
MKLLTIISHLLMEEQILEAKNKLGVDFIITMPEDVKSIWSDISPYGPLPSDRLDKIIEWIEKESVEGDYVLVQGDFGATYYIVDFCFKSKRIPIYSTTKREVEEFIKDGQIEIKRIFKHINFRKYMPHSYEREV